jgi:hypothetical protein
MSFLINPFTFAVAGGDFESIATVTVGSGGAANIEFTSIAADWQHLQLRGLLRTTTNNTGLDDVRIRLNGVTTSSYAYHTLEGNGSTAGASSGSSLTQIGRATYAPRANATASAFNAIVVDILDYAANGKTRVVRTFAGVDLNGSGVAMLGSGFLNSTNAVTSVSLFPEANNFAQHSTLALYGVKAP